MDKSAMLSDVSGLYQGKSPFQMKFDDVSNRGSVIEEPTPQPRLEEQPQTDQDKKARVELSLKQAELRRVQMEHERDVKNYEQ